jgi:hypothetical protein
MAAAPADACECSFGPLSDSTVREATHVFVFRVEAATLENSTASPAYRAVASIDLVDSVLGDARPKSLGFSTHWCCGSSLDLGHYYAAFLQGDPGSDFFAHAGNLLPLGLFYGTEERKRLEKVVRLGSPLEACFGEWPSTKVEISPPPPPPRVPGELPLKKDLRLC